MHILCMRYGTVLANTAVLCMRVRIVCLLVCGSPGECYYNTLIMLRLFFIIECGSAHFLCAMHVFEVRASSSSLGYISANFCFFHSLQSIAELPHGETLRTYSLNQSPSIWCSGNRSLRFGITFTATCQSHSAQLVRTQTDTAYVWCHVM